MSWYAQGEVLPPTIHATEDEAIEASKATGKPHAVTWEQEEQT